MKVVYYALFAVGASGMMDKLAQLMKNLPAGMAGNMQDMAMKLMSNPSMLQTMMKSLSENMGGNTPPDCSDVDEPVLCTDNLDDGVRAVQNPNHTFYSGLCSAKAVLESDPSAAGMMGMLKNMPMAGNLEEISSTCCARRDICYQTCGMTMQKCWDDFNLCVSKKCKGDQMCPMVGSMYSAMLDMPLDSDDPLDAENLPSLDGLKCSTWRRMQSQACTCVDSDEEQDTLMAAINAFYQNVGAEERTEDEMDVILEKWDDGDAKRADLFYALAKKYKGDAYEVVKRSGALPNEMMSQMLGGSGLEDLMGAFMGGGKKTKKNKADKKKTKKIVSLIEEEEHTNDVYEEIEEEEAEEVAVENVEPEEEEEEEEQAAPNLMDNLDAMKTLYKSFTAGSKKMKGGKTSKKTEKLMDGLGKLGNFASKLFAGGKKKAAAAGGASKEEL